MTENNFWTNKRVCITGGAGFLGSHLIENLKGRGATDIFVPKIEDYNLVEIADVQRMLDDSNRISSSIWRRMWVELALIANTRLNSSMTT